MPFNIFQRAASKASMTTALIRPRGETSKPFLPAQPRIAFSCSGGRPEHDILVAVEVFVRGLPAEETVTSCPNPVSMGFPSRSSISWRMNISVQRILFVALLNEYLVHVICSI
jgi:hypothetical protein